MVRLQDSSMDGAGGATARLLNGWMVRMEHLQGLRMNGGYVLLHWQLNGVPSLLSYMLDPLFIWRMPSYMRFGWWQSIYEMHGCQCMAAKTRKW